MINDVPQAKPIQPPTVAEVLAVSQKQTEMVDDMQFEASDVVKEKRSQFMAYAAKVASQGDIRRLYHRIKYLHPEADHIALAYKKLPDSREVMMTENKERALECRKFWMPDQHRAEQCSWLESLGVFYWAQRDLCTRKMW